MGDIEHTGLFRLLDPSLDWMCGKEALLGESALGNFQDMQRRLRPGSYDADLAAMTRQEVADGFAEGVFSARELDQMFGGAG